MLFVSENESIRGNWKIISLDLFWVIKWLYMIVWMLLKYLELVSFDLDRNWQSYGIIKKNASLEIVRCLAECFSNYMMIYMYVFILQLKVFEWRKHGFWSHVIWKWFAKVMKKIVNYVLRTKKMNFRNYCSHQTMLDDVTVHCLLLFISDANIRRC